MKHVALSIRQPYAWAILHGGKDIENRKWKTNFRGTVLVHAGKAWHDCSPVQLEFEMQHRLDKPLKVPCDLDRGGIVGSVDIVDCVSRESGCGIRLLESVTGSGEHYSSPWFEGRYGFVLANPRPLPFLPCRGILKFFQVEVPDGYLEGVK